MIEAIMEATAETVASVIASVIVAAIASLIDSVRHSCVAPHFWIDAPTLPLAGHLGARKWLHRGVQAVLFGLGILLLNIFFFNHCHQGPIFCSNNQRSPKDSCGM